MERNRNVIIELPIDDPQEWIKDGTEEETGACIITEMPSTDIGSQQLAPKKEGFSAAHVFADQCEPGKLYTFNPPMVADAMIPGGYLRKNQTFAEGTFLKKKEDGTYLFQGFIGKIRCFFGVELEPGGSKIYQARSS